MISSSFIDRAKQSRGKVFVHCNMGINRSASVAVAYLVVEARMDLLDAVALLKKKRGICLTNRAFRRQLVKYALEMGAVQGLPQRSKGPDIFGSRYDNLDSPSAVAEDEGEENGKSNKSGLVGVLFNQSDTENDIARKKNANNERPKKKQQIFTFTPTLNRNSCFSFDERKASLDLYDKAPFFGESKINQDKSSTHTSEKISKNEKFDMSDLKKERKKDVFADKTTLENNEFSRHDNSHNQMINANKGNITSTSDIINKPSTKNSKNDVKEVFHSELQYSVNRNKRERKKLLECTEQNSSPEIYENVETPLINYALSDDFSNINLSSSPSNEHILWQRKEEEEKVRRLVTRPFNDINHNSNNFNILKKNNLGNTLFTNQQDTKNKIKNFEEELYTNRYTVAGQSNIDIKTSVSSNYSIPYIEKGNINTLVISNEFKSYTSEADEAQKNDDELKKIHHFNSNVNKMHSDCRQKKLENFQVHSENSLKNLKNDGNLSRVKNNHFIKDVNNFATSIKPESSPQTSEGVNYFLIADTRSSSLSREKANIRNNPARIQRFDNRSSLIVEKNPFPNIYRNSQALDEIPNNIRRITSLDTPLTTTVSYSNVFNVSDSNSYNENFHNNVVYIHSFNNLNASENASNKSYVEDELKKSNIQQMNLNSYYHHAPQPVITSRERFNAIRDEIPAEKHTNHSGSQLRKLSMVQSNTSSSASPNISKPPLLKKVLKPTSPQRQPMQFSPNNQQEMPPFQRQNLQFSSPQLNQKSSQLHKINPPIFKSSFLSSNSFSIPLYFRPSIPTYENSAPNINTTQITAYPSNKTPLRRASSLKLQPKSPKNQPQTDFDTDGFANDYQKNFIKKVEILQPLAPKSTGKQYHCLRVVQEDNNDNRHSLIITGFHNNFLQR